LRLDKETSEQHQLSEEQLERAIVRHEAELHPCMIQERRRNPRLRQVEVELVVDGKGQVLASRVDQKRHTELARCIAKQLRTLTLPRSPLPRTIASFTLSLPYDE
jgi:hypothetical protein